MPNETQTEGSAAMQAELWGEGAADWAAIAEQERRPWLGAAYELVLDRLRVAAGTDLLDVGCGAGRFVRLAADRGAQVNGIDATREFLSIARERTPEADLREGDLQFLPYDDAAFDVVTGFNSFFYAADPIAAFREAGRVLRRGGHVAVTAFGRPHHCQSTPVFEYLGPLLPQHAVEDDEPELHAGGVLEEMLAQAGLQTTQAGYIKCVEEHPDVDTVVREWLSVAPIRMAIRHAGEDAVREALVSAIAPLAGPDGSVCIVDEYRYVIASAPAP